jgi:hypothetical protein
VRTHHGAYGDTDVNGVEEDPARPCVLTRPRHHTQQWREVVLLLSEAVEHHQGRNPNVGKHPVAVAECGAKLRGESGLRRGGGVCFSI